MPLQPREIEVFRAGDYPQKNYSVADVAKMARRYDPNNEHRAYLKATHRDGGRAYGLFDRVRAEGDLLIAHLSDNTPPEVVTAFETGQISGWSAEIYPDYKGDGPYLKAVALLGATPPAVKGLQHALDFEHQAADGDVLYFAMIPTKEDAVPVSENPPTPTPPTPSPSPAPTPPTPPSPAPTPTPPGADAQRFAEIEAENARLKAENAENAARLRKLEVGGLRSTIHAFAEAALKAGKLNRGDVDSGVESFMEAIDGVTFETVAADGTKTPHEARHFFNEFIERRIVAVPQGVGNNGAPPRDGGKEEINGGDVPVDPASVNFREECEAYAAEHKVSYATAMRKLGGASAAYRTASR